MFVYLNGLLSKSLDTGDAFHVVVCVLVAKQLLYPASQLLTDWEGHGGSPQPNKEINTITRAEHESRRFIAQTGKNVYRLARGKRKQQQKKRQKNGISPSPNGRLFFLIRVRKSLAGSTLPTW